MKKLEQDFFNEVIEHLNIASAWTTEEFSHVIINKAVPALQVHKTYDIVYYNDIVLLEVKGFWKLRKFRSARKKALAEAMNPIIQTQGQVRINRLTEALNTLTWPE